MKRLTANDIARISKAYSTAYMVEQNRNGHATRNHARAGRSAELTEAHRLAEMRKDIDLNSLVGKSVNITVLSDGKENLGTSVKWGDWINCVEYSHIDGTITRLTDKYIVYNLRYSGKEIREYIGRAFAFCDLTK